MYVPTFQNALAWERRFLEERILTCTCTPSFKRCFPFCILMKGQHSTWHILLYLPIPPCTQNADVIVGPQDHSSPYSAWCGTTFVICYYLNNHQRQVNMTSGDRGLSVAELHCIPPVSFWATSSMGKIFTYGHTFII